MTFVKSAAIVAASICILVPLLSVERVGADEKRRPMVTEEVELSARQGDVASQTKLGLYFLLGPKETRNASQAINWLKQASQKNYGPAEYLLGMILLNDKNDIPKVQEGGHYLMRSAEHGCAGAAGLLGNIFLAAATKNPNQKAEDLAVKYVRQGAEGGDYMSKNLLAKLYSTGNKTIHQDMVSAYAWIEFANGEHPNHRLANTFKDLHQQLRKNMSSEDLVKANVLVARLKRDYGKDKYELCSQSLPDEVWDEVVDRTN